MSNTNWIIVDTEREGYAIKTPLEGWIFTILRQYASRFPTKQAAEKVMREHYKTAAGLVVVEDE